MSRLQEKSKENKEEIMQKDRTKDECQSSPNGQHWFTQHIGDQNQSTFTSPIGACVFCKRVDLNHLPNYAKHNEIQNS